MWRRVIRRMSLEHLKAVDLESHEVDGFLLVEYPIGWSGLRTCSSRSWRSRLVLSGLVIAGALPLLPMALGVRNHFFYPHGFLHSSMCAPYSIEPNPT